MGIRKREAFVWSIRERGGHRSSSGRKMTHKKFLFPSLLKRTSKGKKARHTCATRIVGKREFNIHCDASSKLCHRTTSLIETKRENLLLLSLQGKKQEGTPFTPHLTRSGGLGRHRALRKRGRSIVPTSLLRYLRDSSGTTQERERKTYP